MGERIINYAPEPVIMERIIKAQYVHREFPVLVARVKQAKMWRERWGRAA